MAKNRHFLEKNPKIAQIFQKLTLLTADFGKFLPFVWRILRKLDPLYGVFAQILDPLYGVRAEKSTLLRGAGVYTDHM